MTDPIIPAADLAAMEQRAERYAEEPLLMMQQLCDDVDRLLRYAKHLQDGHKKLHNRCQEAEAALPDWEDVRNGWKPMNGSTGRKLLAYRVAELERANGELYGAAENKFAAYEKRIAELEAKYDDANDANNRMAVKIAELAPAAQGWETMLELMRSLEPHAGGVDQPVVEALLDKIGRVKELESLVASQAAHIAAQAELLARKAEGPAGEVREVGDGRDT